MFNNKFWLIIAITLFSVLCCLGSIENVQTDNKKNNYTHNEINNLVINTLNTSLKEEIKKAEELKCPWDENTTFHQYRNDVDYTIPCSIYTEAVKQGKKEYATLMVAISIWETGWYTSDMFVSNNNFGGMRGSGGWMYFNTKEDGVKAFVTMLSKYYINQGLTDAYKMQTKYANGSKTWANNVIKVNNLLNEI